MVDPTARRISSIQPNRQRRQRLREHPVGGCTSRNVFSNVAASIGDFPPLDINSKIDDRYCSHSSVILSRTLGGRIEVVIRKSSPSIMRFLGRIGGNSTKSSTHQPSQFGFSLVDESLLTGSVSDMVARVERSWGRRGRVARGYVESAFKTRGNRVDPPFQSRV